MRSDTLYSLCVSDSIIVCLYPYTGLQLIYKVGCLMAVSDL